jgi:hypothetical protein
MSIAILVCTHVEYTRSRFLYTRLAVPHRRTAGVVGQNSLYVASSTFLADQRFLLMGALSAFVWCRPWSPSLKGRNVPIEVIVDLCCS